MVSLTSSGYAVMTDQDGVFTIDHETGQAQGDQGRLTKKTYELLVEAKGYEKLTIPVDAQAGGRVWVGRHQIKPDQADVDPTKPVGEKEEESIRFDRGSGATVGY